MQLPEDPSRTEARQRGYLMRIRLHAAKRDDYLRGSAAHAELINTLSEKAIADGVDPVAVRQAAGVL